MGQFPVEKSFEPKSVILYHLWIERRTCSQELPHSAGTVGAAQQQLDQGFRGADHGVVTSGQIDTAGPG